MPNNWKTYKLGDLISYQKGFAFKSDWFKDKGDLVVRVSDTTNNSIDISSCHRIDEEKAKELQKYKLEKDDILIATVGSWPPNFASVVGKVVKVPLEADGALLNQNAVRLKSIDEKIYSKKYIYYLMKSEYFLKYIVNTAQGSANQASIKLTDIFDFKFNIPKIEEQKSIASILSAIDDKIENNLAINKTIEEMAMALYKHWFVDFGPFQDGEFVESELGRIPKGWEVKRLDEIITVKRGGSPRPIQDFLASEGLPWVKISDATASNSPYLMETKEFIKEEGLRKTVLLKKGSLILSNSASPGIPRFLELDACIHDGWLHFPEINRFGKYLLYLTFLRIKEELIQKGNGSVFTNLKTDILKSQLVTLPPLDIEQKINLQIKSYFKKIRNNCIENQTLTQLRDTLLPKLISGEVRLKEFQES